MTTTTTGRTAQPWPSRREREGRGPRRPTATVQPPAPRPAPRHAAADPDVTERLPIVVPQQRSAGASYPPRPAVGSGIGTGHRVDGRVHHPRNGLGVAALCLGALGLPFGLVPVTGFLAAGLGVLALAFGIAGWSRSRSRVATNSGTAVTGATLGLIALALGVIGTVAFLRTPDRLVYDLDALTAPAAVVTQIGE